MPRTKDGNLEPFNEPEFWSAEHYEVYALALADAMYILDAHHGGGKGYDPLTLDTEGKVAYSYVFDLWDGGREHPYESLAQLRHAMLKEACMRIEARARDSETESGFSVDPGRLERYRRMV